MLKKAIVLVAALALTGCYQAMDQAAQEQAAAEAEAQQLSKAQATWTNVVNAVPNVRATLVKGDFDTAKRDLDVVYRQLYTVVTAPELTDPIRSRVTRVFPTLIQLQGKVEARDKEAAVLADKLDDLLRDTNDYMIGAGWLSGGGAGRGIPKDAPKQAPKPERDPNLQERDTRDEDRPMLDNPVR